MCEVTEREFNKDMILNNILMLLTCGIFSFVWMAKLSNRRYKLLNKKEKGGIDVILTILTCGIYSIYWNYKMGEDLHELGVKELTGIRALVLSIFGLGKRIFVAYDKEIFLLENGKFKEEEILSSKEVKYQKDGDIRISYTGFSWTTFFFNDYPAIFRRDYKNAIIISIVGLISLLINKILFVIYHLIYYTDMNFDEGNIKLIICIVTIIYFILRFSIKLLFGFRYNIIHQNALHELEYIRK